MDSQYTLKLTSEETDMYSISLKLTSLSLFYICCCYDDFRL